MDHLFTLNRRELLKTTTGLLTGYIVAGSPLALIAPGRAWAVDLAALSSSEGFTLLSMARTIAPHDKLDDAAYALVIQVVDADAAKDANILTMVKACCALPSRWPISIRFSLRFTVCRRRIKPSF